MEHSESHFEYIGSTCKAIENDTLTLDAIKDNTLVYRVIRLSDKKVIRDCITDLEKTIIFISKDNGTIKDHGTIKELKNKGFYSWEEIFDAVVIAACDYGPESIEKKYE